MATATAMSSSGSPASETGRRARGRGVVYLGSASGLSTAAAWTAESDQANAQFGRFVASAGDVNGDGYGDVIVGAPFFDNGQTDEGRTFVYLGSASGLSMAAAWTAESDQTTALFGSSVASAGDVNGDGYGDVIVAARLFDNGQTDEGRAFMYFGSASGLSTYPFGEHRCGWRSARRDRGLEHSEGGLPVDVCFEERERAGDFERLAPEGGRELEDALRRP
jgi:hypothetical protein